MPKKVGGLDPSQGPEQTYFPYQYRGGRKKAPGGPVEGTPKRTSDTMPDDWGLNRPYGSTDLYQQEPHVGAIAVEDRLPLCYGKIRVEGKASYWNSDPWTATGVISFCEGEIEAIDKFYIASSQAFQRSSGHTDYYRGQTSDITFYTGVGSTHSPLIPSNIDHTKYTSVAHVGFQAAGDTGLGLPWWTGVAPGTQEGDTLTFMAEVRGKKVPDPSAAPYTPTYSNNSARVVLDLLYSYGGVPGAAIDYPNFAAAATTCTTNGFQCNIAFTSGTTLREALKTVLNTCCGELTYTDGKIGIFIDAANAGAALLTLNEQAGTIDEVAYEWLPAHDRPTRVIVEYQNEAESYKVDRTEPVEDPGVADGILPLREEVLKLPGVTTLTQACKLRDYYFNARAIPIRITGRCGFTGVRLSRGNKIHVETLSGMDADCCVEQATVNEGGFWRLLLKPYDADVYSSTPDTTAPPIPRQPPTGGGVNPDAILVPPHDLVVNFITDEPVATLTFAKPVLYQEKVFYTTSYWIQTGFTAYDGTKVNDGVLTSAFGTLAEDELGTVTLDLGTGVTKAMGRCVVHGTGVTINIPTLTYSDNGSDYTTVTAVSSYYLRNNSTGNPVGTSIEWDTGTDGAHRYWRVTIDALAIAGGISAYEVQFYEMRLAVDPRDIIYDIYELDPTTNIRRALLGSLNTLPTTATPFRFAPVEQVNPAGGGATLIANVAVRPRTIAALSDDYACAPNTNTGVSAGDLATFAVVAQAAAEPLTLQPVALKVTLVETETLTATGDVGIGTNAPATRGGSPGQALDIVSTGASTYAQIGLGGNRTSDGFLGDVAFYNEAIGSGDYRVGVLRFSRDAANNSGLFDLYTRDAGTYVRAVRVTPKGSTVLSPAALATSATDGFVYVPTCAGAPTGTPTTQTGTVPVVADTTNKQVAAYFSGWMNLVPPGAILPYAGTSAPTGYLLCDGSSYAEATYPALFAVLGHTWGGDPGGGNFKVPDLRQKFPLGKAASGTGSTLGGTGGEIDHDHTITHTHTIAHTHDVDIAAFDSDTSPGFSTVQSGTGINVSGTGHVHSVNPPNTTSGASSAANSGASSDANTGTENPPWISVNYIVKT